MKADEIKLNDWYRMLFGAAPPEFLIEVFIRALIIFILLIVSMRLLGRRMSGQLNRIELTALVSLAAAVGVPLQAPDRGIIPAFIIAFIVVWIGRWIASKTTKSERFEKAAEDELSILVTDGVVNFQKMLQTRITLERLFAELRSKGIRHLGEVKRLYIEPAGAFTIVREEHPREGLCLIPAFDRIFIEEHTPTDITVCAECGKHQEEKDINKGHCTNCHQNRWTEAIC